MVSSVARESRGSVICIEFDALSPTWRQLRREVDRCHIYLARLVCAYTLPPSFFFSLSPPFLPFLPLPLIIVLLVAVFLVVDVDELALIHTVYCH